MTCVSAPVPSSGSGGGGEERTVDRMSATDAGFYFAESENTPMHVGSVAVSEGPAPSYGDVIRLLLSKLPLVPRYRQRVREVPMQLGRPLWVDDPHFQILYHVRHTAVPGPGSDEQLRNLAGRVLGQRLDMAKPLWEVWLVEGLENDRWAIISKVHHCMVDGIAGTDLMQVIFDLDPNASHEEPRPWTAQRDPSSLELMAGAVQDTVTHPLRQLTSLPGAGTGPTGTFGAGLVPRLQAEERVGRIIGLARRPFDPAARGWTKMEYRR